jgi:hypothetical protein
MYIMAEVIYHIPNNVTGSLQNTGTVNKSEFFCFSVKTVSKLIRHFKP